MRPKSLDLEPQLSTITPNGEGYLLDSYYQTHSGQPPPLVHPHSEETPYTTSQPQVPPPLPTVQRGTPHTYTQQEPLTDISSYMCVQMVGTLQVYSFISRNLLTVRLGA